MPPHSVRVHFHVYTRMCMAVICNSELSDDSQDARHTKNAILWAQVWRSIYLRATTLLSSVPTSRALGSNLGMETHGSVHSSKCICCQLINQPHIGSGTYRCHSSSHVHACPQMILSPCICPHPDLTPAWSCYFLLLCLLSAEYQ